MFDIAAIVPNVWPDAWEYEPNGALRLEGNFLSEDFCVLDGEHFLVRSVLQIPVHGLTEDFGYGVWCSLKKEHFIEYVADFDSELLEDSPRWWSWLCNMAQPYYNGEEPLGGHLRRRSGRRRPLFYVADEDHPLASAQREGITPEDVLAIYEFHGHTPEA